VSQSSDFQSTSNKQSLPDPPGFALVKRRASNREVACYVPIPVKEAIIREEEAQFELEVEALKREEDAREARALRQRVEQREHLEQERLRAKDPAATLNFPEHPPVRPRHTVPVFDWAAAHEHVRALKAVPGGDKDVVKRDLKQFEQAMSAGPWRRVSPVVGWKVAFARLAEEMPNFAPVTQFIAQRLALAALSKSPLQPPPILLLGEPGVGKTHYAERVAQVLGTHVHRHAFDSLQASGGLRGTDRHWYNTTTGALWDLVVLGDRANPVVLLDELDKAKAGGTGYRPADELLSLLEPVSSARVKDQSIKFEFDASHVWFIATANDPRQISDPIRSRFTEFTIQAPDIDARLVLANTIYRATLERVLPSRRVRSRFRPPTDLQICRLAWLAPRQIRKATESVLAAAVLAGRWHLEDEDFDAAIGKPGTPEPSKPRKKDGGEPFAALVLGIR
jgi:ATP-dependent Lon protease